MVAFTYTKKTLGALVYTTFVYTTEAYCSDPLSSGDDDERYNYSPGTDTEKNTGFLVGGWEPALPGCGGTVTSLRGLTFAACPAPCMSGGRGDPLSRGVGLGNRRTQCHLPAFTRYAIVVYTAHRVLRLT